VIAVGHRAAGLSGIVGLLLSMAGCSSPPTVTLTDGVEATVPVSIDSASEGSPAPADGGDAGDVLSPEGAFDGPTGRPLRVLVRARGSASWFWVDAQTGAYVGPGSAPEPREVDPGSLVGFRPVVPFNCEDDGSGLHVAVSHPTVEDSGRVVAVESIHQTTDCSDAPFAVRAMAVDTERDQVDARFRVSASASPVMELEHDPSGVWLLITLADGTIEWQGRSGWVVLNVTGADGRSVEVEEASWGTEPPTGPVPGRIFTPTRSNLEQSGLPYPAQIQAPEAAGTGWAIVLGAGPVSSPEVSRAVMFGGEAGYEVAWSDCYQGAPAAMGWIGDTVDGQRVGAVVVFVADELAARLGAQTFEADGQPSAGVLVTVSCPS